MKLQKCATGFGIQCPPDEIHVRVYFLQQGSTVQDATRFFCHYNTRRWSSASRQRLKNWKRLAWTWIWHGNSEFKSNATSK